MRTEIQSEIRLEELASDSSGEQLSEKTKKRRGLVRSHRLEDMPVQVL
jgi:hypothetical protein